MSAEKERFRKWALNLRCQISGKDEKSRLVTRNLLESSTWKASISLSSYLSFQSEVDTSYIVHAAFNQGKELYVLK
jgi:5-formyltetrahydrofolate cyclo-ligase